MRKQAFAWALAAWALTWTLAGRAQPVILKVHHMLPATSNPHLHMIQPWCDKINKESGNRLKCQIYPAMQLGGTPSQLFDQVRDGVVDVVWAVPTYSAGRFLKSEVFELPFMAHTGKAGSQALWAYVRRNALDEFKGVRLILMHMHDGAMLNFTRQQPKALEDLKGLKIRAATRINSRMIAALGATPVQMPLPQVPESLAKGVIDGAAVPWEGVPAIKLQEIAKYHLETPAGTPKLSNTIFLIGMNPATYDRLAPELKKVIDDNSGMAASAWAGSVFDDAGAAHRKAAQERGNTIAQLSQAQYQRWIKATENVDDEWVKDVTAKGADGKRLLSEARALVKQYEQ
jgi:TRAP-type C4-dicarboxylate transport system substrate-binding protein